MKEPKILNISVLPPENWWIAYKDSDEQDSYIYCKPVCIVAKTYQYDEPGCRGDTATEIDFIDIDLDCVSVAISESENFEAVFRSDRDLSNIKEKVF